MAHLKAFTNEEEFQAAYQEIETPCVSYITGGKTVKYVKYPGDEVECAAVIRLTTTAPSQKVAIGQFMYYSGSSTKLNSLKEGYDFIQVDGENINLDDYSSATSSQYYDAKIGYYHTFETPGEHVLVYRPKGTALGVMTTYSTATLRSYNFTGFGSTIEGTTVSVLDSEITIRKGIKSIGYSALNTVSFTKITIEAELTEINAYAFFGCTALKSFEIPEGISALGSQTFRGCTNLERIVVPTSVETISIWVFYGCAALENIEYKGTMDEWNAITFDPKWSAESALTKITCTDGEITL